MSKTFSTINWSISDTVGWLAIAAVLCFGFQACTQNTMNEKAIEAGMIQSVGPDGRILWIKPPNASPH